MSAAICVYCKLAAGHDARCVYRPPAEPEEFALARERAREVDEFRERVRRNDKAAMARDARRGPALAARRAARLRARRWARGGGHGEV